MYYLSVQFEASNIYIESYVCLDHNLLDSFKKLIFEDPNYTSHKVYKITEEEYYIMKEYLPDIQEVL